MEQKQILALGFFDGVHLGHGALLEVCRATADEMGCDAGAVTFDSHPGALVSGDAPGLINTAHDRRRVMTEQYYMDRVICLPFDEEMRTMPWQEFFRMLREKYGAVGLVCGHDFRFGYRGQGNASLLKEACRAHGMACRVIPEQKLEGVTVSSTRIRGLIESGEMETAARFLGHPHFLTGEVVTGRNLGHRLGFPTANLLLPEGVVCPRHGVYACRVRVGQERYMAVANVGRRPTVNGHRLTIEPWILDFSGDLYGQEIRLEFHRFLRPEEKFDSLEALRQQVLADGEMTRKIFENK